MTRDSLAALTALTALQGNATRKVLLWALRKIGHEARWLRVNLQIAWGQNQGPGLQTFHPDGPVPPDKFWYRQQSFDIPPIPCKLLTALWEKNCAAIAEVAPLVWGTEHPSADQIKSALREINKVLQVANVARAYGRKKNCFVRH